MQASFLRAVLGIHPHRHWKCTQPEALASKEEKSRGREGVHNHSSLQAFGEPLYRPITCRSCGNEEPCDGFCVEASE